MIASLVAAFHNFWPISGIALFATGCIWVRYSFVITPVNYSLAAVRFTNLLPAHIRPPITLFPRSICSSQRPPQASLLVLRSKHPLTAPNVPGSPHVSASVLVVRIPSCPLLPLQLHLQRSSESPATSRSFGPLITYYIP
jgi:hypothetical protein